MALHWSLAKFSVTFFVLFTLQWNVLAWFCVVLRNWVVFEKWSVKVVGGVFRFSGYSFMYSVSFTESLLAALLLMWLHHAPLCVLFTSSPVLSLCIQLQDCSVHSDYPQSIWVVFANGRILPACVCMYMSLLCAYLYMNERKREMVRDMLLTNEPLQRGSLFLCTHVWLET